MTALAAYFELSRLLCHAFYVAHGLFLDVIDGLLGSVFGFELQELLKEEFHLFRREL